MRAYQFMTEVRIITPHKETEPLLDTHTVRLYHGTSDPNTITAALEYGITGDTVANRRYSYEMNNNPKGIFVTPLLRIAKEFGSYVMEIHAPVSELEAAVWPGGSFTVQGQMSNTFNNDDDRENERIRQRDIHSIHELEMIRSSDRPELAAQLLASGEPQALFTGDLNSNSIRAIWVSVDPTRINQPYKRLSIKQFLRKLDQGLIPTRFGSAMTNLDPKSDVAKIAQRKIVKPRDTVSADKIIKLMQQKRNHLTADTITQILKQNPTYIRQMVWSDKQYHQVIQDLGITP